VLVDKVDRLTTFVHAGAATYLVECQIVISPVSHGHDRYLGIEHARTLRAMLLDEQRNTRMQLNDMLIIGAAAGLVSFVISLLIVHSQQWHGCISHDHDLDGVQKVHALAVPRVGGLAVVGGILLGMLVYALFFPKQMSSGRVTTILLLIAAGAPAFIAGIAEDLTKRISVRIRLLATFSSSLLASTLIGATVNGLDIWGVDNLLQMAPVAVLVTALVVAGGANAVNIIDGFNGLAGSVITIMALAIVAVAVQHHDMMVATIGLLGAGSAIGFLLVNFPRGKLFLGDGGAYFLGFWVAEAAVLLLVRNANVNAWQVLSICAYPVIEVMFSMYRRRIIQQVSPGAPDRLHLHTLVYRRVVRKLIKVEPPQAWLRNATTAGVIVPWVAVMALISVLVGQSMLAAMALVLVQIFFYIALYRRLVRGRWIGSTPEVTVGAFGTEPL
jgi:UDP-N-acetylmuramyl pentapeptide phosphotransferase/UDP-N-acetylglucosamine-1-phosphate transferase